MSNQGHALRYIDKGSFIHGLDPISKLIWVVVVAIGLFTFKLPFSGLVLMVYILGVATLLARVPLLTILRSAGVIFSLGILLAIFHFFADPGNVVWCWGPLTVTDAGIREGIVFFFRISVVVLATFVFLWTTNIRDFLTGLVRIGLPYKFAFAVFLSMRFLPLVQREVDAVKAAHAIRGRAARSPLRHRFKLWQRYMFTVLINGLRKAEFTAVALDCRGFGAFPDRTFVKDVHFTPVAVMLIVVSAALIGTMKWMEVTGQTTFLP